MAVEAQGKVESEPCRCVSCDECNGFGFIWVDLRGHYLGRHRSDDMDETERCEGCGGSGIIEECDRCQVLREMDMEP